LAARFLSILALTFPLLGSPALAALVFIVRTFSVRAAISFSFVDLSYLNLTRASA
jgi:hypothetical protein